MLQDSILNIAKRKLQTNILTRCCFAVFAFALLQTFNAQNKPPLFKVIAFYTAKNDLAHISFVHEANKWFPQMGPCIIFLMIQQIIGVILMKNFFLNTRL